MIAAAALALAATSWLVETAAGAAGWWRWTVAVGPDWLHGVPPIGLVDWACVAADFLLPFLVWTSRLRSAAMAVGHARGLPASLRRHAVLQPRRPDGSARLAHWLRSPARS